MDRPSQTNVVQTTNAATDRTKATKETTPEGKKKIYLKGPLSEIFFRALNILYEKDSLYEGNYSMENVTAPKPSEAPTATDAKEKTFVYTAIASQVNSQDVTDLVKLHSAAKQEGGKIRVLLLLNKGEKLESLQEENTQLDILLRFTQMQSITTDSSLAQLVESVH